MKKYTRIIALLLCAATLLCCFSCGDTALNVPDNSQEENVPEDNDSHTVALSTVQESDTITLPYLTDDSLNPYLCQSETNRLFMPLIYQSLFTIKEDGTVENCICSELATANNKMFRLTIDEFYFSDGTQVTLEDIAYSVSCALNSESYYHSRLSNVIACYISGDTLVIETKAVTPNFDALLTFPICKKDNPYIGTGLYKKYTDSETDEVTLSLNTINRDSQELSIKTINLVGYDNMLSAADDFSVQKLTSICTDLLSTNSPGYASDYDLWAYPSNTMIYLAYNTQQPIFSLGYSRYAVGRGIDRETIAKEIYNSLASPSCLGVPKASAYYSENAAQYGDYAPDIIPEYLKNRGYRDYEGDGTINAETYYGWFNFYFDIVVNSESEQKVAIAYNIADSLASCGIKVEVRSLVWDEYIAAIESGDYYTYIGEINLAPNYDLTRIIGTDASMNYTAYSDSTLDEYLAAGVLDDEFWTYFLTCSAISPIVFKSNTVLTQRGSLMDLTPINSNFFNDIANAKAYTKN